MAKQVDDSKTWEEALNWLRDHGFDLLEAPGTQSRVFLKKLGVSCAIEKNGADGVKIFAYPGYLVSGEIAKLAIELAAVLPDGPKVLAGLSLARRRGLVVGREEGLIGHWRALEMAIPKALDCHDEAISEHPDLRK